MMKKLSQQEKKKSIDYQKKIYIVSSSECCIQKTSSITWITCKKKMKYCAGNYMEESHPCSTALVLSNSTQKITPNV